MDGPNTQSSQRHGCNRRRVDFDELEYIGGSHDVDLRALDDALAKLENGCLPISLNHFSSGDNELVSLNLLLLPGMDGTGLLFEPFIEQLPRDVQATVVSYPPDQRMDYDQLLRVVDRQVDSSVQHVVLGESFSGPLAVRYAHGRIADIAAVVLCASFLSNPLPLGLRWLPHLACRPIFAFPIPRPVLQALLLDFRTPTTLVARVKDVVRTVDAAVLAARVRAIASVNVAAQMKELQIPVLYLVGKRDRLVGSRGASQVRAAAPNAEFRAFNAPHLLLQTRPQEAADAIMKFLEENGVR